MYGKKEAPALNPEVSAKIAGMQIAGIHRMSREEAATALVDVPKEYLWDLRGSLPALTRKKLIQLMCQAGLDAPKNEPKKSFEPPVVKVNASVGDSRLYDWY